MCSTAVLTRLVQVENLLPSIFSRTKKQLEAAMKAEREKKMKVYRQKYDVYLQVKPVTNSPFDTLIAAAQVMRD